MRSRVFLISINYNYFQNFTHFLAVTLRELLRIDSVISVNLFYISFLSFVLKFTKNTLSTLKHILIRSILGKITIDDF